MALLMSEMTWPEYSKMVKESIIFLPVGSTEQHGYHLPLGTDYIQINEISKLVAKEVNGIVAPAIPYGYKSQANSGGGQIYSGTTSLDGNTLILLVKDVLLELIRHGATKIVVMDGHIENSLFLAESIDLAIRESAKNDIKIIKCGYAAIMDEDVVIDMFPGDYPGLALEHAAFLETSMMSYLAPDLVKMDRAVKEEHGTIPLYDVFPQPPDLVPKSGSLSDPTQGNKADGKTLIDNMVQNCIKSVKAEFNV